MTLREILEQVQMDIVSNLNAYIQASEGAEEDWYSPLSFHDDAPRVETDKYRMGIYLSSPDGEVFTSGPDSSNVMVTLDCILDGVREHSNYPQLYLSAVVDYLRKKQYGVSSNVATAQIVRTDLDAPVNAFVVAISITVYANDMDYDFR